MSLTLLPRLILGFFVLACIGGAIGYVGYSGTNTLAMELRTIADDTAPELVALGKVRLLVQQLHDQTIKVSLTSNVLEGQNDDDQVVDDLVAFGITYGELEQAITELRLLVDSDDADNTNERLVREIESGKQELYAIASSLIALKQQGQSGPEVISMARRLSASEQSLLDTIEIALESEIAELGERQASAEILSVRSSRFIIAVSVVGVLTMLALGLLITKYIWGLMGQLRLATQEAQQASRAKSEFLAGMSHEIRTPMNAIIGMADLMAETPLNGEQREYLRVFRTAGANLLEIINSILDLSKVEAGEITLEQVNFDLGELVESTAQVMAVGAHEKGLELNCQVSPDLPRILVGDPVRIRQIITNLLSNAIKFTDSGEVAIHVYMDPEAEEPGTVSFCVSDTGIGIPSEKLESIFDIFTQADTSTTRQYGGTGLGLSICKYMLGIMGGRIWVESELGEGSTFHFTLVLPIGEENTQQPPSASFEDLDGLKILIVDDNSTNRLILVETLSAWKARPTAVEDGNLGVAELKRAQKAGDPYQLLLLDRRMPGIDGFRVAERIKDEMPVSDVTIMMLTSDNRSEDIGRCQDLGLARYLVKPVGRTELFQAICGALKRTQVDTSTVEPVKVVGNETHSKLEPLRVLLVEDSSDNRLLVQTYLKKTPYQVDIAENGQVAVDKFTADPYDVVLMDMQMPVMDGYTATRKIREWETQNQAQPSPIIALTAHALKEDEQKSLDAGCDFHLTKPIKKDLLLEAISNCTRKIASAAD